MTKTQRLLALLQLLRCYRYPVTAAVLAEKLGISARTVYRDIASLQQQGVDIEGSAGLGYQLRSDHLLPPLLFNQHELDALLLGLNWVRSLSDANLNDAAQNALVKIQAVLPAGLAHTLKHQSLLIGSNQLQFSEYFSLIRQAINGLHKMVIRYLDQKACLTKRIIWPVVCGIFDSVQLVGAYCEMREGFRNFRLDRIQDVNILDEHYPKSRIQLLNEWRAHENLLLSVSY